MKELLEVYDLKGKFLKAQERDKFYSEIKKDFNKTGKISKQVKNVRLILMNSKGRIYLQKRSRMKSENSGLYDKTIGGHVKKGYTYDMTTIEECAEELGFPAAILSGKEFDKLVKSTDLKIVAIFKKIDEINEFKSVRFDNKGNAFIQPSMSAFYLGYYDGAIRFVDGESSGIEVFSLKDLLSEIKNNPQKFTEDIKWMIKKYEKYLKPIK
ncbi:MAG: NUDIX domain-containing protein [Candidatus Diapherotrites archaeon]|nr:NUDIX domain-containing protein [Candidatus Diapherotrites archaeon]